MISPDQHDAILSEITFDDRGLVPAIAQDAESGAVLMMAWMNEEAVRQTLSTGAVTYWSRSRQALWRKGETSGHTQTLNSFLLDCDGDTILLTVSQKGAACHTGEPTCFFRQATDDGLVHIGKTEQGSS